MSPTWGRRCALSKAPEGRMVPTSSTRSISSAAATGPRSSRWVSADGGSYFILYELESEAALTSPAYLERLNHPTPWSRKMMPHHRNMVRGLCRVEASSGTALGLALLTVRSWSATTLDL